MSKPPKSPPQKHLEGSDADKDGDHRGHAAEQEETARKHSAGRPDRAKR